MLRSKNFSAPSGEYLRAVHNKAAGEWKIGTVLMIHFKDEMPFLEPYPESNVTFGLFQTFLAVVVTTLCDRSDDTLGE